MQRGVSLVKRFMAYVIDVLIVNIIAFLPFKGTLDNLTRGLPDDFMGLYSYLISHPEQLEAIRPVMLTLSIVSALSMLLYFTFLHYKIQQTIGDILVRIIVKSRGKLTLRKVLIRDITLCLIFTNLFLLLILDIIYLLIHKQRLTEKWSETWLEDLKQ